MSNQPRMAAKSCLLQVGLEVVPVYGDDQSGWSLEAGDFCFPVPPAFRYRSLGELFFALVNLNVSAEGSA